MLRILVRRSATLVLVTTVVFVAAAFSGGADLEGQPAGNLAGPATTTGFTDPTVPGQLTARLVDGPPAPALSRTSAGTSTTTTTTVGGTVDGVDGPASVAGPAAVTPTTSPPPADGQPDQYASRDDSVS